MCCQTAPGIPLPSDFGTTQGDLARGLRRMFSGGKWSFDYWESDAAMPHTLYPRPSTVGREGLTVDAGWGGICSLLTDAGCSLPFSSRPFECRDLRPNALGFQFCAPETATGGKMRVISEWRPYQDLILAMIAEREGVGA
jgi:hypothetical protein